MYVHVCVRVCAHVCARECVSVCVCVHTLYRVEGGLEGRAIAQLSCLFHIQMTLNKSASSTKTFS